MTEPINLNKFRKSRAKDDARSKAAENRVRFGRAKGETVQARLEAERARREHEAKKRED